MSFPYTCPACGRQGRAGDHLDGRIVKCPTCAGSIVLNSQAVVELNQAPAGSELPPPHVPQFGLPFVFELTAAACATLTFFGTLRSAHAVGHYAALVLLLVVAWRRAVRRWPRRSVRWVAGVVAVVAAVGWYAADYYVVRWTAQPGTYDVFENHYTDYHLRWGNLHYYRKYRTTRPGELLSWSRSEGPMSASGKPHGVWTWSYTDWDATPMTMDSGLRFYWYGEEISEGEWHLRNR